MGEAVNDPDRGNYQRLFADDFERASELLAEVCDGKGYLHWLNHDWQAFCYREPGVCLVFYPHKSPSGTRRIRVRNEQSEDKARARELILAIRSVFHCKTVPA